MEDEHRFRRAMIATVGFLGVVCLFAWLISREVSCDPNDPWLPVPGRSNDRNTANHGR